MWIATVGLVVFGLILLVWKQFTYWSQKNVPQKSVLEILLGLVNSLFPKKSFAETVVNWYNEYPKKRYIGIYPMAVPTLLLRDPDLIKQITVRDFDHFTDHKSFLAAINDPIVRRNLFTLTGQKWYKMRGTLSPSFTSSKMKQMFTLISDSAEGFVDHFSQKGDSEVINFDMNDNFKRFANDVIASIGFGVKCDSLKDRNNEFYLRGEEVTRFFYGIINKFKLMFLMLLPKVAKTLKVRMFRSQLESFFLQLVSRSIKMREEQNIVRPDMIHLLMQARKGIKDKDLGDNLPESGFATCKEHVEAKEEEINENLSVEDITGQVMVFLLGGFDSVSRSTCFAMYELAINPDIQQRLLEEIKETLSDCNGKVTYEALMKMKYMDMVVSESLRLWPIAIILDRVCVKPYTIQPETGEEKLQLAVGDKIWLPTFALHRDPNIYQNPDKFDPERFNDENKGNVNPYTFLAFGLGPRNCIGSRFALLEMKILIFHILLKFELVPTERTQVPMKLSRKELSLAGEMGFWIGLKRRTEV